MPEWIQIRDKLPSWNSIFSCISACFMFISQVIYLMTDGIICTIKLPVLSNRSPSLDNFSFGRKNCPIKIPCLSMLERE